jgi:hypothetical protein
MILIKKIKRGFSGLIGKKIQWWFPSVSHSITLLQHLYSTNTVPTTTTGADHHRVPATTTTADTDQHHQQWIFLSLAQTMDLSFPL